MSRSGYNLMRSAGKYLMLSRSVPDLRVSDLSIAVLRGNPDLEAVAWIAVLNAEESTGHKLTFKRNRPHADRAI
jgi:hypothetical protein